jgi:hypothetical protein
MELSSLLVIKGYTYLFNYLELKYSLQRIQLTQAILSSFKLLEDIFQIIISHFSVFKILID